MKDLSTMNDSELLEELVTQSEWAKDDAFEFTAFGRGDNGFKRDRYIASLYNEAVKRGLRSPLEE